MCIHTMQIENDVCARFENFVFWHDGIQYFQLGAVQNDTSMFPEVDSTWKVSENLLSLKKKILLLPVLSNFCFIYMIWWRLDSKAIIVPSISQYSELKTRIFKECFVTGKDFLEICFNF